MASTMLYEAAVRPNLENITKMRANGKNTAQIAAAIGINVHEFRILMAKEKDLAEAWQAGEVYLIELLEKSLVKEAVGHFVTETETITTYGDRNKTEVVNIIEKKRTRWCRGEARLILEALKHMSAGNMNAQRWAEGSQVINEIEIKLPPELLEFSD